MAGYRDDTNSLRGKPRPGRLTIIWPHQLGFTLGSGAIADSISDWYSNTYCYAHPRARVEPPWLPPSQSLS